MAIIVPPRCTSILDNANAVCSTRRKSSDGTVGDAAHRASGGDHNPDARGIVHAVDVSLSMPGTPYWEDRFGKFDVHAWQRTIAAQYVAANVIERVARWPWLADGGYMVGFDGRVDIIFNPKVSLSWRQNGAAKQDHNQHGHFSIAHTTRSENDTQPIFGSNDQEVDDDMTPEQIEQLRQEIKSDTIAIVRKLIPQLLLGYTDAEDREHAGILETYVDGVLGGYPDGEHFEPGALRKDLVIAARKTHDLSSKK